MSLSDKIGFESASDDKWVLNNSSATFEDLGTLLRVEDVSEAVKELKDFIIDEADMLCGCDKRQYQRNEEGMTYHNDECFARQIMSKIKEIFGEKLI